MHACLIRLWPFGTKQASSSLFNGILEFLMSIRLYLIAFSFFLLKAIRRIIEAFVI